MMLTILRLLAVATIWILKISSLPKLDHNRVATQICKYVYVTADREHCFDLSGLIRAVGVTNIHLRQYSNYKQIILLDMYRYKLS